MPQRTIKRWITIRGVHVPIFEDEPEQDAYNKAVAKYNEDIKFKQMAEGERQAKQARLSQLPKRIPLADIPAEVANRTTSVMDLATKKHFTFQEGTMIVEVTAFAGKGCSRPFRIANEFADKYGGRVEDWQHCAGKAHITDGVNVYIREVHWAQLEGGVMREAFIKYYRKGKGKKR